MAINWIYWRLRTNTLSGLSALRYWARVKENGDNCGIAGVDIFKMVADGKAIEHWDVSQEVGDPKKAANANGVF